MRPLNPNSAHCKESLKYGKNVNLTLKYDIKIRPLTQITDFLILFTPYKIQFHPKNEKKFQVIFVENSYGYNK